MKQQTSTQILLAAIMSAAVCVLSAGLAMASGGRLFGLDNRASGYPKGHETEDALAVASFIVSETGE